MGRTELGDFEDARTVGLVFVKPFLDHSTKVFPEGVKPFGVLLGGCFQFGQDLFGQAVLDLGQDGVVLQHLARDVKRQVLTVDHTGNKTQPWRQQFVCTFGDEDLADIKFQMAFALRIIKIERPHGRKVKKAGIFNRAFGLIVDGFPRIIKRMRIVFVEFLVLFLGDFGFRTGPKGGCLIEGLVTIGLHQNHRNADMIGIGFDDMAELVFFGEFLEFVGQMQGDLGAAAFHFGFGNGVFALAVR